MGKVKDYCVVSAGSIEELQEGVQSLIKEGWQPTPNMIHADEDDGGHWWQPMMLMEVEDEEGGD